MVDLNLDFAALIGSLTLLLALIGYVFETGYKTGYYQHAYLLSKSYNQNKLKHYALAIVISGILLPTFLILFSVLYYIYDYFPYKENISNTIFAPINQYYISYLGLFDTSFEINSTTFQLSHIVAFFLVLYIYLMAIYYFGESIGKRSNLTEDSRIEIKTILQNVNGNQQECIVVKSIYADDNDFFYYLDLENKWGSVGKFNVVSMKQIGQAVTKTNPEGNRQTLWSKYLDFNIFHHKR